MATPPHFGRHEVFGPFHRVQGRGQTQLPATASKQLTSGELWGRPSRNSGTVPVAQAHHGPLDAGAIGIEFYALCPPDKLWGPPEWRTPVGDASGQRLVWIESDVNLGPVVKVKIAITRVTQAIA